MATEIQDRAKFTENLVVEAGKEALDYFQSIDTLEIETKGHQDMVSNADKNIETLIRKAIDRTFPDDGIVGEEHDNVESRSGYTWVIDPIDGTANFVRGIPAWCVVIAVVHEARTKIGVTYDAVHDELYSATEDNGAFLNHKPIRVARTTGLDDGTVAISVSNSADKHPILRFAGMLADEGGVFIRIASGALTLAYVAAGRVNGYVEAHMNAWDCLAGQLLIKEAGGRIEDQNADDMLINGGRVVVSTPVIFDRIVELANEAFE